MVTQVRKIPNEVRNQQLLLGIETVPGVRPATGYVRMNGTLDLPLGPAPLSDQEDVTGTYMADASPARGTRLLSGNFSAPASFEGLPRWNRLALEAGAAPTSGTGPDYTYVQEPSLTVDSVNTASALTGVLGNGFEYRGLRVSEWNIATDYEDASGSWQLSGTAIASAVDQLAGSFEGTATGGSTTTVVQTGAAWTVDQWAGAFVFLDYGTGTGEVRQVLSNTADTLTVSTAFDAAVSAGKVYRIAGQFPAGVAALNEEKIKNAGTKLWILPFGGTPSTTNNIKNRVISSNVRMALNLDPKGFLENPEGEYSGIFGRGNLRIDGQVRLEFDRYDELAAMKALKALLIQFENTGSELAPGVRKLARVAVPRAYWNEQTRDTRNNNLTQTLSFRAYLNTPPLVVTTRNGLATL